MPTYYVVVTWDKFKDPEYVCKSGYTVEAPNTHDAEQEARILYANAGYCFELEHITAIVLK